MRVLYVCNHIPTFTLHRLPLAAAATAAGHEVHLAGPPETTPEAADKLRALGVAVHDLGDARGSLNPWRLRRSALALADLYRELAPEVVHAVPLPSILAAGLAARRHPVPLLAGSVTGLGYVFTDGPGRCRRALIRAVVTPLLRYALARPGVKIIFQNPDDRDVFLSRRIIAADAAVMIRGSGVDTERFRFTAEPPVAAEVGSEVLLPARLLWDKGVGEFVRAAELLSERGVKARFTLLGDSDAKNPAAVPPARVAEWVSRGLIRHEPAIPSSAMPERLAQTHVVCLPSYREGMSKSLLEALAVGRAVVTTDVPGCRDVVTEGLNGWLVPPRDAGALAAALTEAITDAQKRAAYGQAGRSRAEKEFALPIVMRQTLALYQTACTGKLKIR